MSEQSASVICHTLRQFSSSVLETQNHITMIHQVKGYKQHTYKQKYEKSGLQGTTNTIYLLTTKIVRSLQVSKDMVLCFVN